MYFIDAYSRYLFVNRENEDLEDFLFRVIFLGNRPMSIQCHADWKRPIGKSAALMELLFRWNIPCILTTDTFEESLNHYVELKEQSIVQAFEISIQVLRPLPMYGYLLNHATDQDGKVPMILYKPHRTPFTKEIVGELYQFKSLAPPQVPPPAPP